LVDWDASLWLVMAGMIGVPVLLVAVLTVVPPAGAFARERRRGTLELLAATPLRAETIVWGKYLFCLRGLLLPSALFGMFMAGVIYVFNFGEWAQAARFAPLVVFSPMIIAMTLYVSAGSNDMGRALCASAAIVAVLFLLLRGRLGFVRWLTTEEFLGPVIAPVVAVTLAAAFRMRERRPVANIVLACVVPFFTLGIMRFFFDIGLGLITGAPILAGAVFLIAGPMLRRERGFVGLATLAIVLFLLLRLDFPSYFAGLVLFASWGFLVAKGARYCGPGALIRTAWVLLALVLVATALRFGPAMATLIPRGRYRTVEPALLMIALVVGAAVSGIMSALFLRLTARQLDGLMGRNG